MTISNTTETAVLKLIFQAIAWANYADNAAATAQTNIGIALHTSDPGDTGDSSTAEIAYTGYTRVNVTRNTAGWTESTGTITPVATISFPAGTTGTGNAAFFSTSKSLATPPTGAQAILWSGTVTPNIATGNGVTPQLTTASTITLD
jgi:hypothetical protein